MNEEEITMSPAEKIVKWIAAVSLLLGIACLVLFQLIGGTLDEAGVIH